MTQIEQFLNSTELMLSLDSGIPEKFAQVFAQSLEDMTPQNKRAFAAIVKLLSE